MQSDMQTLTSFEKFDMVVVELETGLQKSLHPVILDGSSWSIFGKYGKHGKDGKHQPDEGRTKIFFRCKS